MRAIDQPEKVRTYFVEFLFNSPTEFERWTTALEDTSFGPGEFLSLPAMELELPKNVGTFESQNTKITLPISYPDETPIQFAIDIASGEGFFAKTKFQIWEIDKGTDPAQSASQFVWRGYVQTSYRNYQGSRQRVVLEGVCAKFLLEVEGGWRAMNCNHRYGDLGCGGVLTVETVVLLAINGKTATTTVPPLHTGRFYHRGYMQKNGVKIGIRNWEPAFPDTFNLLRRPPSAWVGTNVQVVVGCTKLIDRCRELGREESFAGTGVAMPAYHPVYESP